MPASIRSWIRLMFKFKSPWLWSRNAAGCEFKIFLKFRYLVKCVNESENVRNIKTNPSTTEQTTFHHLTDNMQPHHNQR